MLGAVSEALTVSSKDGVRWIELNRPEALNAWTPELGRALLAAVRDASADSTVRSILFSGAGRAFSAGADLNVPRELTESGDPDLSSRLREIYNPVMFAIHEARKPVIAAVNGAAAGIGCSLALACDLIVAAESAYFLLAFVRIGLIPDGGATQQLVARIGYGRAAQLAMLGERLPAPRALAWGLVNEVVPDSELAARSAELAQRLAAGPTVALGNMKRVLRASALGSLRELAELEAELQQSHAATHDFAEGLASFRERRAPRFTGS
jgi:2-(1,2-epoxy-1,2-dihydrophenyl)acetyl-CoA isomerase